MLVEKSSKCRARVNPTTTGDPHRNTWLRCDLTGENSESKLSDFSWLCFADILAGKFFSPAWKYEFKIFCQIPLYDTFLENLD